MFRPTTHALAPRLATLLFALSAATAVAACSSDNTTGTTPVASTVSIVSGGSQSAVADSTFTTPLTVMVKDQDGTAFSGATVNWAIISGGGTLGAATTTTSSTGMASVTYTAGDSAGTATITATVGSLTPATFTETITAKPSTTTTP